MIGLFFCKRRTGLKIANEVHIRFSIGIPFGDEPPQSSFGPLRGAYMTISRENAPCLDPW